MLTSADFVEDNDRQYILNLAPAEGSRPLSVLGTNSQKKWHTQKYFWARDDQKMIKG